MKDKPKVNIVYPSKELSMEEILKEAVKKKAKYQIQYYDYNKDEWTIFYTLQEKDIEKLTSDNSIRKIRLEFDM